MAAVIKAVGMVVVALLPGGLAVLLVALSVRALVERVRENRAGGARAWPQALMALRPRDVWHRARATLRA